MASCKEVSLQPSGRSVMSASGCCRASTSPCKSDDSVAQLIRLSGIKKGPEFTVVKRDLGDATFGSKTLVQG